jgi:hypothetical protein
MYKRFVHLWKPGMTVMELEFIATDMGEQRRLEDDMDGMNDDMFYQSIRKKPCQRSISCKASMKRALVTLDRTDEKEEVARVFKRMRLESI